MRLRRKQQKETEQSCKGDTQLVRIQENIIRGAQVKTISNSNPTAILYARERWVTNRKEEKFNMYRGMNGGEEQILKLPGQDDWGGGDKVGGNKVEVKRQGW